MQIPIEIYPASDSVTVFADESIPSGTFPITNAYSVGEGAVLQPGESANYNFVITTYSDPSIYQGVYGGEVMARVYHSTAYDPTGSPVFSSFAYDQGSWPISPYCDSGTNSTSVQTNPYANSTEFSSATESNTQSSGDIPEFPGQLALAATFATVLALAYVGIRGRSFVKSAPTV